MFDNLSKGDVLKMDIHGLYFFYFGHFKEEYNFKTNKCEN